MAKEEFTRIVEQKHFWAICDVCGHRQQDTWRGIGNCEFCNKHVCRRCVTSVCEDESGDYPHYKCACPEHKDKLLKAWEQYQEIANMDMPDLDDFIKRERACGD